MPEHIRHPENVLTVFDHHSRKRMSHLVDRAVMHIQAFQQVFPTGVADTHDVVVMIAFFVEEHIGVLIACSFVLLFEIRHKLIEYIDSADTALCLRCRDHTHLNCLFDRYLSLFEIKIRPSKPDHLTASHSRKEAQNTEGFQIIFRTVIRFILSSVNDFTSTFSILGIFTLETTTSIPLEAESGITSY